MAKPVHTSIDNLSLLSRHFAAMNEADGVKALIADGFTKDEGWAKKAYKQCVDDVRKADEIKKPVVKEKPEPGN